MATTDRSPREIWESEFGASPIRHADFSTMSGIPLEPVYGPDDGDFPGQFPYTRGPYASMYRSKLWTMRMFAGFGTAEDTNWRFKEIIRAGGTGLSTAFDMPTLLGIDSDDPMALGEVGRCGVAVDTLADMEDLYAGIDLGEVTTSMTINSPAAVIFAMFIAQAEKVDRVLRRVVEHVGRERPHGPIGALVLLVELHAEVLLEQRRQAEGLDAQQLRRHARVEHVAHVPAVVLMQQSEV
jgi:methylmalonyl-CoA mutase N-terminal domain/subunit